MPSILSLTDSASEPCYFLVYFLYCMYLISPLASCSFLLLLAEPSRRKTESAFGSEAFSSAIPLGGVFSLFSSAGGLITLDVRDQNARLSSLPLVTSSSL